MKEYNHSAYLFNMEIKTFSDFNLNKDLLSAVDAFGFDKPTPIQAQVIPEILKGQDIIGCAQTGTGKTAAFLIPLVNKLLEKESNKVRCVILSPTRELAQQIEQNLIGFIYGTHVSCQAVYGGNEGAEFSQQKASIQNGVDIIVATPGRLKSHISLGYADFSELDFFILDEADRMLDMGFIEDIKLLNSKLPEKKQTLLFSATMAPNIRKLAEKILNNPTQINLSVDKPAENINQLAYLVYDENKVALLEHIVKTQDVKTMVVFASRKSDVDRIANSLKKYNFPIAAIHSGKDQSERNEILRKFKAGHYKMLVATDILSRGIDIDDLSHVVNHDIPDDPADYVHRVGRTARAGKSGAAISFINPKDQFKFYNIEKLVEKDLEKLQTPEEIGKSPGYDPKRKSGNSRNKFRGKSKHKHHNKGKKHHGQNQNKQKHNNPRPKNKGQNQ